MQKSTFITRQLAADSPFLSRLSRMGWQVSDESLVHFSSIDFDSPPAVDWIFFYSKKGIQYFFEQEKPDAAIRYGTMGSASAEELLKYGVKADFIGTGEPESTALAFESLAKSCRVLFPCAVHSRHSIRQLLSADVETFEVLVYYNEKRKDIERRDEHVLVFTSPLNAEAYFEQYDLQTGQQLVAIGQTTAGKLRELGFENIKIARQPTEMALAETVSRC